MMIQHNFSNPLRILMKIIAPKAESKLFSVSSLAFLLIDYVLIFGRVGMSVGITVMLFTLKV